MREFIDRVNCSISNVKTWKDLFMKIVLILFTIFAYTMWENRQDLYSRVTIPKSENTYVQRDLEILGILRSLNDETGSMRSYILEHRPAWDNTMDLEKVHLYGLYEQVANGVSSVMPRMQGRKMVAPVNEWEEVFANGFVVRIDSPENVFNLSPPIQYVLQKDGVTSRVYYGIYTKDGKMKYGLAVDFDEDVAITKDLLFVIEEYSRILRYFLDSEGVR